MQVLVFLLIAAPAATQAQPVSFSKSTLAGASPSKPTTLAFGPDERLYVGQQNGLISAYTVSRTGPNSYAVAATETITLVQAIANHDDDGSPRPDLVKRQLTGLVAAGTPANPVLYVSSSDPRIGAGSSGTDANLDTNSGVISRLTWTGAAWQKLDLVRGLPRSEENHSTNGMWLDAAAGMLYVAQGGNTNQGATSNNFALLPEYALSAAILSVDLNAIGNTTYDLPTLDDESRPGDPDSHDPFGGNDGNNQARLVPGGPVQVYSPGYRNPYDLVVTEAGRMYTVDNGPNAGWGDVPLGEGTAGCTNGVHEPGATYGDGLQLVTGPGYYGGHPNPTRANPANTFNPSQPQSPVSAGNPIECDFRAPGPSNGALAIFPASTNGIAEYTASNFGGALRGDLLTASFDNSIKRVKLDAGGGTALLVESLLASVGSMPLDVVANGDADVFPGTIWVALYGGGITVFEPADFGACFGVDTPALDEDGDGYDNADEIDNGTDPCSPGDLPPDRDGDLTSDLNDPDDDNDGLPDWVDPFAIDATNGTATTLPVVYRWDNDAPAVGGLLGLGFTGLMANGIDDYAALFDAAGMTAGGAAGVLTVDQVGEGTARAGLNTQAYAFQFGVAVGPASPPFTVHTRILAPFAGLTPTDFQTMGFFVGTGDQDNYVRLAVVADGGTGGIGLRREVGGVASSGPAAAVPMPGPARVDLFLTVDPAAATVQAAYAVLSGGVPGPIVPLGAPEPVPPAWFGGPYGLAVGIIATSEGPGSPFPATWDFIAAAPGSAGQDCVRPDDCDADGYPAAVDCDDRDLTVFPGAPEVCNARDDDCDGSSDEGNPGGGAACASGQAGACAAGTVQCLGGGLQCVADVTPSAEVCASGIDEDCDGDTDEADCELCAAADTVASAIQTRRTTVRLKQAAARDKLVTIGTFVLPDGADIAPDRDAVTVRVMDDARTYWQATIPPGAFQGVASGRSFKLANPSLAAGGIKLAKFTVRADRRTVKYRLRAERMQLPPFYGSTSAVTIRIGGRCFADTIDRCVSRGSSFGCE